MNHKDHHAIAAKTPPELHRVGPLVTALLRIYASNLRRSWRNTPHAAFVDATIHLEALVTLVTVSFFALIEIALSRSSLPSLSISFGGTKYSRGMLVVLIATLVVLWFVDRKLKPYEFVPGAGSTFDAPRDRVIVWIYFASGFGVIILDLLASNFLRSLLPIS
jgi:hypothetical protein